MRHAVAFVRFWYDFIVGDDWRVAAGVVAALVITRVLTDRGVSAWWLMPAAVVLTLLGSLRRAAQARRIDELRRSLRAR